MDKIFKIGLLILGFSYLAYLFCPLTNQTGRYRLHNFKNHIAIMDTVNSDLYMYYGKQRVWIRTNPRTSGMPSLTKVEMSKAKDALGFTEDEIKEMEELSRIE